MTILIWKCHLLALSYKNVAVCIVWILRYRTVILFLLPKNSGKNSHCCCYSYLYVSFLSQNYDTRGSCQGAAKVSVLSRKLRWEPRMRDRRDRASVSPGEEGSFRVPDKKGRADLEIGQHLSAQGTNLH